MAIEVPEAKVLADLKYCEELKRYGLPHKVNSFYYIRYPNSNKFYIKLIHFTRLTSLFPLSSEYIRAVSIADLGEWLPIEIELDNKKLKLYFEKKEDGWEVGYKDETGIKILSFADEKEANARVKCFLWIVKNYKKPDWFKTIHGTYWRPIVLRKPYPRNKKDKKFTIQEWIDKVRRTYGISQDRRKYYEEKIQRVLKEWNLSEDEVILVENADPLWKGRAGRTKLELKAVRIGNFSHGRSHKIDFVLWLVPLKEPKNKEGGN